MTPHDFVHKSVLDRLVHAGMDGYRADCFAKRAVDQYKSNTFHGSPSSMIEKVIKEGEKVLKSEESAKKKAEKATKRGGK